MHVKGTILNVGDGDAILLELYKDNQVMLILIDGGDKTYASKVAKFVQSKCTKLGKKAPDIVVCTHYDSDHIAGIIEVAKIFGENINCLWVHQPTHLIKESFAPISQYKNIINGHKAVSLSEAYAIQFHFLSDNYIEEDKRIIESITQLEELLDIIQKKGINTQEPIAGECNINNWPEVEVIGPTRSYYETIFAQISDPKSLIMEESRADFLERKHIQTKTILKNPCDLLKTKSQITPTNKASTIIKITVGNKKLLFTGDAGIESLENVKDYPEAIEKIYLLKIPHHGSNNNISKKLVELMNPQKAYNSGNRHEDPEVIQCLRQKQSREVFTTREKGDLIFEVYPDN